MNHYEFLAIGRATLPSLVRGAINRKQRQFDARGASPEQQQQLDNARRVLLSETLRLEYDATLTDLPGAHAPPAPTTGVSPSQTFPWQVSPPATPRAPHQPIRSLAVLRVLVPLLLSILVLLHVAVIAAVAQALDILARIESGTPVSFAEAQDSDRLVEILGIASFVALIITAIVFLTWKYRAYQNVERLGHAGQYSPGWAVGGYFVPFLNFSRPYQIMSEIWIGSGDDRGHWLVNAWWALWILGWAVSWVVFGAIGDGETVGESRALAYAVIGENALAIAAAIAAAAIVWQIVGRQRAYDQRLTDPQPAASVTAEPFTPLAAETTAGDLPAHRPTTRRKAPLLSLGLLAAGAIVAAAVIPLVAVGGGPTTGQAATLPPAVDQEGVPFLTTSDLSVGDCFNHVGSVTPFFDIDAPADIILTDVERVSCSSQWQFVLLSVATPPVSQIDFPASTFFDDLAFRDCDFNTTLFVAPSAPAWSLGDHRVECLLEKDALFTPQLGQCYLTEPGIIYRSTSLSCDRPHLIETFSIDTLPLGDTYPSDTAMINIAERTCRAGFEPYVGRSYDVSEFFYIYNLPSQATWEFLDDRQITCFLHTLSFTPLTGSMRSSGR